VINELEKVRVKRFTPTAKVLRENLSTGCSEMAPLRTRLEGDSCPSLLSIDPNLLRPQSLCI
jgi:hypothetical protein